MANTLPSIGIDWRGLYGKEGVYIPGVTNLPEYPQIPVEFKLIGTEVNAPQWIWAGAATTADPRGIIKPDSSGQRIASCRYTGTAEGMDLRFSMDSAKQALIFICDWDGDKTKGGTRVQSFELLSATGARMMDPLTFEKFRDGVFWKINLPSQCILRVRKIAGVNAVVNAIFLDTLGPPPDVVAPIMVSAEIDETGRILVVSLTEPVTGHEGFSLMGELPPPIEFASVSEDRKTLTFNIVRDRPIWKDELTLVNYSNGDVKDDAGNPLGIISQLPVVNKSALPGPVWRMVAMTPVAFDDIGGVESGMYLRIREWPPAPTQAATEKPKRKGSK